MDLQLAGRRALVSGGTRGLGRTIVETLLAEGAQVGFCARTADQVSAAVDELKPRGTVFGAAVDITDTVAVSTWVTEAAEQLRGIDIVVANVSALAIPDTEENWDICLDVDLMGTVRLVQAALPHLRESDAAAIVAISSVSGREIDFTAGPYSVAKTAVVTYMQGLAHQLASVGIRANSVSPGNIFFPGGIWDTIKRDDPALYEAALALNPTGRMATRQEVADGVVFLSSPRAGFISGTNLVIDGALTRGIQL